LAPDVLAVPLTWRINNIIQEGEIPTSMERGESPPSPQKEGKIQGGELQAGVHFA
jgi:hypothetical protein